MILIHKNIAPVLERMHGAIDQWEVDKDTPRCTLEIRRLATEIPTLFEGAAFTRQVMLLLTVGGPARARRLVDAMGPHALTTVGYLLVRGMGLAISGAVLVSIVILTIWAVGK